MRATFRISAGSSAGSRTGGSIETTSCSGLWNSNTEEGLQWLGGRLRALGLCQDNPIVKRRGQLLLEVTVFAQQYRLQMLSRPNANELSNHSVSICLTKRAQIIDRLLGRAPFDSEDAFARVLQDVLEREAAAAQAKVAVLWR